MCFRNKAIADYLSSNGYIKALSEFQKESDMVSTVHHAGSKWMCRDNYFAAALWAKTPISCKNDGRFLKS